MTRTLARQITWSILGLTLFSSLAVIGPSQTQTPAAADLRGVIRLRVRIGSGEGAKAKGLARKRFFLIKGSLEENKSLMQSIEQQPLLSRDCYYRGLGASEALIHWLRESDCESIYCREVEAKDVEGAGAVREFQEAIAAGEKDFGSRELARKWLTVNLSDQIRDGYYRRRQDELQTLLKHAEQVSKATVLSVMTDLNGTAFFTDLEPGTYVVSNILATEIFGNSASFWNCEVKVKPGDLATEKPFLISNPGNKDPRDVRNIKCRSVDKPLPACPTANANSGN
ncbi:MAG TPA: hypothetical protein VK208_04820 [Pyrinomonadaceae bacterium]|nr:hypothetical protein [Pyrinomonadaceae bacterium]